MDTDPVSRFTSFSDSLLSVLRSLCCPVVFTLNTNTEKNHTIHASVKKNPHDLNKNKFKLFLHLSTNLRPLFLFGPTSCPSLQNNPSRSPHP